jgi:hypothetical protein
LRDHDQGNGEQQQLAGQPKPVRQTGPWLLNCWLFVGHCHDIGPLSPSFEESSEFEDAFLHRNRSNYGLLMWAGSGSNANIHAHPKKHLWDQYIRANCAVSKNVKCGTAQH